MLGTLHFSFRRSRCSQILRRGLTFCEYSETLLIKAVKQEERAGNLDGARELLSRLKHVGIDNVRQARNAVYSIQLTVQLYLPTSVLCCTRIYSYK